MERMQQLTTREEIETGPTCWECGYPCEELSQDPRTTDWKLVGPCCMREEERDEECTCHFAGDSADASGCYAHGGMPDYRQVAVAAIRKQAAQVVAVKNQEVA